jgi:hypothetical protein
MIDGSIKKQKNRSVGVTVLGWCFILQGWIAVGYYSDIGILAWIFVVLFACIGIGMLKLLRAAYIGALLVSGFFLVLSLFNFFKILFVLGSSPLLGIPIVGILISGILIFFLTRNGIRKQFDKNNNKNISSNIDEEI